MPITFHIPENATKPICITQIESFVAALGLSIIEKGYEKPWGGYVRIDEPHIHTFIQVFFQGVSIQTQGKLTPKLLFVAPQKRLSWQYHHRRAELWKVVTGPIKVEQSDTDTEPPAKLCQTGELITHAKNMRHRLIGADSWGIVAEIWQHTDITHPSDESDIVRVQDDFGR